MRDGRGLRPVAARRGTSGARDHEDRHDSITRHRPVFDRLDALGRDQAALSIISFNSTPLAERTRVAVDRVLDNVNSSEVVPPPGLQRVVTGSAVVGRDTNTATSASIQSTKTTTIVLVIVILLVVYRSPVLATVPPGNDWPFDVCIAALIALISVVPGLGFRVISVTEIFVVVVLFGAGTDYSLFLVARYREELRRAIQD